MKNKKLILSDELVKKIMKTAYFMALKILKNEADAEDIASDAMLTILEKSEELKDEKAFEAWANRIVVNKCYNHIKKMKPVLCGDYGPEFLDGAQLEEYNAEFLPEEFAVNEEKRKLLMEIIKEDTTEIEMMTIMHFYYNEESIAYIAKNMDCAEITVKKRLASARKKIKDGIEKRLGKGVVLMAVAFTVLGKAMRVEASETTVPESLAVQIDLSLKNGGLEMGKIAGAKAGLSGGAIAGICGGVAAGIAAIAAGVIIATNGGKSDKTDGNIIETTTIESTQETTEVSTEETTTAENVFVPQEFVTYEVKGIDFVAPSARTEDGVQCTFFWNYTEDDFFNWFHENVKIDEKYEYRVNNEWGYNSSETRNIRIKNGTNEVEGSEISIETGIFNKDIPSNISFEYTSKSLDKSMEVAEAFLVYMGLGEYAEDLLHSKGIVHIKTENKLSEYDVESNMYVSSYYETYTFRVSVKYSDWEFESNDNIEHIKPTKLEIFDEHHKLTDYMGKSEFDNTTLRGLVGDIISYSKENINNTIKEYDVSNEVYNYYYNSEDSERRITDAGYNFMCTGKNYVEDKHAETNEHRVSVSLNFDENGTYEHAFVLVSAKPIYEERRYEGDITTEEIKLTCDGRHSLLKKLIPELSIDNDTLYNMYVEDDSFRQDSEEIDAYYFIMGDFDSLTVTIYPQS